MDDGLTAEYQVSLLLDDTLDYYFGRAVILAEHSLIKEETLTLDFKGDIMSVFVNRQEIKSWIKDISTLIVPVKSVVDSSLEVVVLFYGYYSEDHIGLYRVKQHHSDKYSYFTHCEPDGMPNIFPCFMDYQVLFKISLELIFAEDYIAVANSPQVAEHASIKDNTPYYVDKSSLAYVNASKFPNIPVKGYNRVKFKRSVVLQCYQFAFAVGEFAEYSQPASLESETDYTIDLRIVYSIDRPLGISVLRSLAGTVVDGLDSIALYLDKKVSSLGLPRQWTVMVARDMPMGGMENPGVIFLDENVVKCKNTSFRFRHHCETLVVVFHELTHLWFGHNSRIWSPRDTVLKEGLAEAVSHEVLGKNRGDHERSVMTYTIDICNEFDNILRCWSSTRRVMSQGSTREQLDHTTYDIGKGIVRAIQTSMSSNDFQIKTQELANGHLTVDRFFSVFGLQELSLMLDTPGIRIVKVMDIQTLDGQIDESEEKSDVEDEIKEDNEIEITKKKKFKIFLEQEESANGVPLTEYMIQVFIVGYKKTDLTKEKKIVKDTNSEVILSDKDIRDNKIYLEHIAVKAPDTKNFSMTIIPSTIDNIDAAFIDPFGKMHSVSCSSAQSFGFISDKFEAIDNPYTRASLVRGCLMSLLAGHIHLQEALALFESAMAREPLLLAVGEYAYMLSNLVSVGHKMKCGQIDVFCRNVMSIMKDKDTEQGQFAQKDVINRSIIQLMPNDPAEVIVYLRSLQMMLTDDLKRNLIEKITWTSVYCDDQDKIAQFKTDLGCSQELIVPTRSDSSLAELSDMIYQVAEGKRSEKIDDQSTYYEALQYLTVSEIVQLEAMIDDMRKKTDAKFRKFRSLSDLECQLKIFIRYKTVFDKLTN